MWGIAAIDHGVYTHVGGNINSTIKFSFKTETYG